MPIADVVLVHRGTLFSGSLVVRGHTRIEGDVGGEMCGTGSLFVGEHARICGSVAVGRLEVHGLICGSVVAAHVIVGAQGRIEGSVEAPLVEFLP